jgi:hypothetical protein
LPLDQHHKIEKKTYKKKKKKELYTLYKMDDVRWSIIQWTWTTRIVVLKEKYIAHGKEKIILNYYRWHFFLGSHLDKTHEN